MAQDRMPYSLVATGHGPADGRKAKIVIDLALPIVDLPLTAITP